MHGSKAKKCTAALNKPSLLTIPENRKNSATTCSIYRQNFSTLIDSSTSGSQISGKAVNQLDTTIQSCNQDVDPASTDKSVQIKGKCTVVVGAMKNLCSDLILGKNFQQRHKTVVIKYGGALPALKVGKRRYRKRHKSSCNLIVASIPPVKHLRIFSQAVNELLLNPDNTYKS